MSNTLETLHQHPVLDPAALDHETMYRLITITPPCPPQKKKKEKGALKLTRLFFNPSGTSATAFDSTSSYGSEFHAWLTCCTELTAKYSESSAFSAPGTALQKQLCEPALARLWCSILPPSTSSKTNTCTQECDENADLAIGGPSSRCCSALGFLHICRQIYTVCFYI